MKYIKIFYTIFTHFMFKCRHPPLKRDWISRQCNQIHCNQKPTKTMKTIPFASSRVQPFKIITETGGVDGNGSTYRMTNCHFPSHTSMSCLCTSNNLQSHEFKLFEASARETNSKDCKIWSLPIFFCTKMPSVSGALKLWSKFAPIPFTPN